jgi:hypothetical protein
MRKQHQGHRRNMLKQDSEHEAKQEQAAPKDTRRNMIKQDSEQEEEQEKPGL